MNSLHFHIFPNNNGRLGYGTFFFFGGGWDFGWCLHQTVGWRNSAPVDRSFIPWSTGSYISRSRVSFIIFESNYRSVELKQIYLDIARCVLQLSIPMHRRFSCFVSQLDIWAKDGGFWPCFDSRQGDVDDGDGMVAREVTLRLNQHSNVNWTLWRYISLWKTGMFHCYVRLLEGILLKRILSPRHGSFKTNPPKSKGAFVRRKWIVYVQRLTGLRSPVPQWHRQMVFSLMKGSLIQQSAHLPPVWS